MTRHDPSALPGPLPAHGRAAWFSELPDPNSIPADWSPSAASRSSLDPALGWNTSTHSGYDPPQPSWRPDAVPDSVPTSWSTPFPDPAPTSWTDPAASPPGAVSPTWNAFAGPHAGSPPWTAAEVSDTVPSAWAGTGIQPGVWTPAAEPRPVSAGTSESLKQESADGRGRRTRGKSKLKFVGALTAAALAGGGVGAGIMATIDRDSGATAPAAPAGLAPTPQPSRGN